MFFHRYPRRGKLEIQATKPLGNQRDLALAYSPGVAAPASPSVTIRKPLPITPRAATSSLSFPTVRLCLASVISDAGFQAVMEGKAVLFKKFAAIDVFDIEIAGETVESMVSTVAVLSHLRRHQSGRHQGPECFEVERQLREKMKIPVFTMTSTALPSSSQPPF